MFHRPRVFAILAGCTMAATVVTAADGDLQFSAQLKGDNETPTVSTGATGTFKATVNELNQTIEYEVSYQNLQGNVTQSHIHLGQSQTSGGVVLFFCTNLAPPAGVPLPQPCPPSPGTVTGTLTAADVVPVAGQGIGAAELEEIIANIKNGNTYANVHSSLFPAGEVRGQIKLGN
jgi:hypothetical protein